MKTSLTGVLLGALLLTAFAGSLPWQQAEAFSELSACHNYDRHYENDDCPNYDGEYHHEYHGNGRHGGYGYQRGC